MVVGLCFVEVAVVVVAVAVAVEECFGRERIECCGRIGGGDVIVEDLLKGLS